MAKKQVHHEAIDEDLIRNLIGGVDAPPRLFPKSSPAAPSPEIPPPETQVESGVTPMNQNADRRCITEKHSKGVGREKEYEQIFLCPQNCLPDTSCRIKRSTRDKLAMIVRILGQDGMTVKAYINNILDIHLEQYREEINNLLSKPKNIHI